MLVAACTQVPITTPTATTLVVQGESHVLKSGEQEQLTASLLTPTGPQPSISARWTSSRIDVCDVGGDGILTAIGAGTASVLAEVNGHQAAFDVRIVPSIQGVWTGQSRLADVVRLSGAGAFRPSPLLVGYYELRATQIHDRIQATDWLTNFREPLSGIIDTAGSAALSGVLDDDDGRIRTNPWTAKLSQDGQTLSGSYVATQTFVNFWGRQVIQYRFEDLSVRRSMR